MVRRESIDVADVLGAVVQPVLRALLLPGELDSVRVGWKTTRARVWPWPAEDDRAPSAFRVRTMTLTDSEVAALPWSETTRLAVELTVRGEEMIHEIADDDADGDDDGDGLGDLREQAELFYSRLQDFIAESRFGWGQLREGPLA